MNVVATDRVDQLVRLGPVVFAEEGFTREATPTKCVLATRVGVDALHYFGVPARPQAVKAMVLNPAMVEFSTRFLKLGRDPTPEEVAAVADDARWLEIDTRDDEPGRYAGHLVIAVRDDEIVDLDLGQFNRPHKNIELPEAARFLVDPVAFYDGEEQGYRIGNGCQVSYRRIADTGRYRRGGDWRKRNNPITGKLIRRMREEENA